MCPVPNIMYSSIPAFVGVNNLLFWSSGREHVFILYVFAEFSNLFTRLEEAVNVKS